MGWGKERTAYERIAELRKRSYCEILMLYCLKLHSVLCQLYLHKVGGEKVMLYRV